jgi:RND family efflux transporter MFP subunit
MINQYFAKSGDWLKAGDPILALNHDVLDAQLAQFKATENLAQIEFNRQKLLYANGAASKQALDQATSTLAADQAQVASTQASIEDHIVRAPFDGQVGIMNTNLGQYVNPGDDLGMMVDPRSFWVEFPVTQQELSEIQIGLPISFTVDAYPGVKFDNKIKYIDNYFSGQTYSLMVRGLVENTDNKHPLYSGMMININVLLPVLKNVIVVDQDDIVSTLYGDSVFLVKDKEIKDIKEIKNQPSQQDKNNHKNSQESKFAQQVFVIVGPSEDSKTVLLSGVKPGDELVTSGQMKLQDGSPIVLAQSYQPSQSSQS